MTQPTEKLDADRIVYYEDQIKQGVRPIAVVYGYLVKTTHATLSVQNFILDGHHKLLAYEHLKMQPALLRIEKLYGSEKEIEIKDIDEHAELKSRLLNCHLNHIKENSQYRQF